VLAVVTAYDDLPDAAECDRLDRLATRALAALAPVSVTIALTPADVDSVLRMRYECVVEMGWATPELYPDGRERDEYDEGASFVVCRDGDEIIGSARVVPPAPASLLPIEREFRIRLEPAARAVEVGRVVVPARYRVGRSHLIMAGLFARSWLVARGLGYNRIVSSASEQLIELYRNLGLTVTPLAPPRRSWGEERAPVELAASERSLAGLAQAVGIGG
jgi:N-acyl-L-homoserine lactone synthetase